MAYNRTTAKAKTVARVDQAREIRIPNLARWTPELPPFQPRCRNCGSKVLARESRCPSCWRPL